MKRMKIYMRQLLVGTLNGKMRFFLMLLGITAGLFFFSLGRLAVNSYYDSLLREVEVMPDNSAYAYINSTHPELLNEIMKGSKKNVPVAEKVAVSLELVYRNDREYNPYMVNACMIGISRYEDVLTTYTQEYGTNLISLDIIAGRAITQSEINSNEKVCMIDRYTAELIFKGRNLIGEYISFNYWSDGSIADVGEEEKKEVVKYQVVGVIEDTYYSEKKREKMQEMYDELGEARVEVSIFCPYNFDEFVCEYNDKMDVYTWVNTDGNKADIERLCNRISSKYELTGPIDKEVELKNSEESLKEVKYAIKAVTLIMLVLTGVFNMSILFFSLKERIPEIGIKKAFGADTFDIAEQFLLEILFTTFLATVIAAVSSSVVLFKVSGYIKENLLSDFIPKCSVEDFVLLLLLAIVQNILVALIPIIRYSHMDAVKSLKAD